MTQTDQKGGSKEGLGNLSKTLEKKVQLRYAKREHHQERLITGQTGACRDLPRELPPKKRVLAQGGENDKKND